MLVLIIIILIVILSFILKGKSNKSAPTEIGATDTITSDQSKQAYSVPHLSINTMEFEREIDIFEDSYSLCRSSKVPNVFFERRALMQKMLSDLSEKFQSIGNYRNLNQAKINRLLLALQQNTFLTTEFIDRYFSDLIDKINSLKTSKAKIRNIDNYLTELSKFQGMINANDMSRFQESCAALKNKIQDTKPVVVSLVKVDPNKAKKTNQEINVKTGWPMAKESAIKRAIESYNDLKNLPLHKPTGNKKFDHEMAISEKVLPHYHRGDIYYKKGEWEKAEKEWVSILKDMGSSPATKLAIMYRKQNRLQDEINVLKAGIELSKVNTVYPGSIDLEKRLEAAKKYYSNHLHDDQSTGAKYIDN